MLEVIWMDYDTLAERLGIERESARQRAKRGHWGRRKDNLGKMQVGVPAEVLGPQQFTEGRRGLLKVLRSPAGGGGWHGLAGAGSGRRSGRRASTRSSTVTTRSAWPPKVRCGAASRRTASCPIA